MIPSIPADRGATAITVAITMVLLMGMAAIAIDLGLGFNERRLDQTGADTGVMAGAVELALGGSTQDVVNEITDFVDLNIRTVSDTEWEACSDSPPSGFRTAKSEGLTPATDCISFFKFEELRVRVPDQEIDTTFGRVIGFDSLTTSALAHARIVQFPGAGNSPPFVALAGVGGGDQICLRTTSSGPPIPNLMTGNGPGAPLANDPGIGLEPDPCDDAVYDPDTQFFGTLDPLTYFNNQTGAVTCKRNLTAYAIAAGIDHPLADFDPDYVVGVSNPVGPAVVEDDCSPVAVAGVNTMVLNTGLTAPLLRCGMLTTFGGGCNGDVSPGSAGGNNVPARLHLGPFFPSGQTFVGENMDNEPLWAFMANPSGLIWPGACTTLYNNRATPIWDYFDKKDELISCLSSWSESTDDYLFTAQVITTPRFAWIPFLAEDNLNTEPSVCPESGGTKCVHFNDFVPVYLQTLYTVITGGGGAGGCDPGPPGPRWGRHDAGEPVSCGKNNGSLDRLSSIVLDCGMLLETICDARPGFPPGGSVVPVLELIR
jgi:hypothetical protein